jgi:hypothetical protein
MNDQGIKKMALPSIFDVVTVIVILLPGFISFVIFRWISIIERKFSEFEITVWSLFMSLVIYAIFSYITGINNIDSIRDSIFLPTNLSIVMGLSLLFGIIPSLVTRFLFRKGVTRGDCWDTCMRHMEKKKHFWVMVHTEKGLEYKGRTYLYGTEGENNRELVIEEPKLIVRDEKGKMLLEKPMGQEILFLQNDIRRVVFLEELRSEE